MASPITINGKPVFPSSFSYTRQDFDNDSARSAITGEMVRQRICTKVKLELTWRAGAMTVEEMATLLQAVDDVFFEVTYFDVHDGAMRTMVAYCGDRTATMYSYVDNKPVFDEIKFSIIEK